MQKLHFITIPSEHDFFPILSYSAVGNSISSGVGNVTRLVGNVGLVARSDDSDVTDDGDMNSSDERNSAAFPSPIQDEYVLETKLKIIEILHVRPLLSLIYLTKLSSSAESV